MAYPTISVPYGLLPVNLIGGQSYGGAVRHFGIASGYAKNIGFGDPVTLLGDGTIARIDASTGAKAAWGTVSSTSVGTLPVGIFLGCSFTSPILKYKVFSQFWPKSTVASDAVAIVADDPDILMKAVLSNAGTLYTSSAATKAVIGANVGYHIKTDTGSWVDGVNTVTGNAGLTVTLNTAAVTATLPLRIVDVVPETALSDGTFVEVIVGFTPPTIVTSQLTSGNYTLTALIGGGHKYRNPNSAYGT